MKSTLLSVAILLGITACSTHDQYMTDRAEATCAVWDRCELMEVIGYENQTECFDEIYEESIEAESVSGGCDEYDSSAAANCIDELNTMGCDSNFETPDSCFDVCD